MLNKFKVSKINCKQTALNRAPFPSESIPFEFDVLPVSSTVFSVEGTFVELTEWYKNENKLKIYQV